MKAFSAEGAFQFHPRATPWVPDLSEGKGLKARSILCAMPQSLSFVLLHVIFSVKDRRPLIGGDLQDDLHAYLATVCRNSGCDCFRAGGVADHVHIAVGLSRTITIAKLVEELKTSSSQWMKARGVTEFAWQKGYAAFSVGRSDFQVLVGYIDKQEAHHAKVDFQEELREFVRRYGVESDERYLWD